jgi:hypothetical protein
METAEQIAVSFTEPSDHRWDSPRADSGCAVPFADQPSDYPLAQRRDSFLFVSEKTPIELICLATLSFLLGDFYTASLWYADLLAQNVDLSVGQRYLASIPSTYFHSWASIISFVGRIVDHPARPYRSDAYFRLRLAYKHLRRYEGSVAAFGVCQTKPPLLVSQADIVVELSHECFM